SKGRILGRRNLTVATSLRRIISLNLFLNRFFLPHFTSSSEPSSMTPRITRRNPASAISSQNAIAAKESEPDIDDFYGRLARMQLWTGIVLLAYVGLTICDLVIKT